MEEHEHSDPAEEREDHERQPLAGEAVEDVPGIAVQEDEAGRCERPGHDGGDERAVGEVPLEIGSAARLASLTRNTAAR